MRNRIFLLIIGLVISIAAQADTVVYHLTKEFYPALKIRVAVNTQQLGAFIIDKSRAYQGDDRPDKQIFCTDEDTKINYDQAYTCKTIYWDIAVKKQSLIGIGARSLDDYYLDNGQWVLSESKNFPRIRGITEAQVCIDQQDCKPLPTLKEPFLFWVWGKAATKMNIAGKQFEVFSDKAAEFINKRALMIQLEPNFRYLNKVFTSQVGDYIERPVSIIMLGQDDRILKDAGGVAKDHVALVNYYTDGILLARDWENRFKETMLHEYIHLLAPCRSFPRWACESLADYYAYKALTVGQLNTLALDRWNRSGKNANSKLGMYQVDKGFWRTKSWNYYSLFYVKGSAFWNELDMSLNKKYRNLDNYLHLLILEKGQYQTDLPAGFVSQMTDILGEEAFNKLVAKYLE